jgi:glycosyltransferase involved in cell wall biosynthesis
MAEQLPADRRDRFRIVPETGETATYWRAADVFCCTSRIESYPHVTQEAMAAGLPLLTTPVFGLAEQVRESINALTYQPGDVRALARLLARLATDDRKRRELADAAPLVLRSLPDPRHMNRRYLQMFRAAAESAAAVVADRKRARPAGAASRRRAASPTTSVG